MRRLRALAAALVVLFAPAALALDPAHLVTQYQSSHWDADQGLPQSSVESLARTEDGYLWFGTEEGLARFDGVRFTVFDRANTPALTSDLINTLARDSEGRLWIGTRRGLVRYEHGVFTKDSDGLPDAMVGAILEDHQGRLWVGTLGGGLFRREGARFVSVPLGGKRVRALLEDGSGAIWAGSEKGLFRLDSSGVTPFDAKHGLQSDNCFALLETKAGLWIGSEGGLTLKTARGFRRYTTSDGLSSARVRALAQDGDGNLWIATEDGGLNRLHDGSFAALRTANGFPSDSVQAVLADAEGSLWVGTSGAGLVQLTDSPVVGLTKRDGLPGKLVYSALETRDGAIWLGLRAKGLSRFANGKITSWTTADGLSSNEVISLAEDPQGGLWVGTYGGGLNHFRDGQLTALHPADGLAGEDVSALLPSRDGALWIGTNGSGLQRLAQQRFQTWTVRDGLPDPNVNALFEEPGGALWIGTNDGLARLENGHLRAWTEKDGLMAPSIVAILQDPHGVLWLGTAGMGLVRFKDGRFSQLTSRAGLPNDAILALLDDGHGNLWANTDRGVFHASFDALDAVLDGRTPTLEPVVLSTSDGLPAGEGYGGTQPSAWKTRDGRLLFATIGGLAIVDPAWKPPDAQPPKVAIEAVKQRGRRLKAPLALGADPRAVEIDYTALALRRPDRVRFRYQLVGYDPEWIDAGARRHTFYPRLPGGEYTFRVVAVSPDGVVSRAPASVALTVAPSPLERTPVRIALGLLLVLLGVGVQRLRGWRLQVQKRALEAEVLARTEELRSANAELARLASRDGLTQIANRRVFDEVLLNAWQDHRRRGASLAVVLCDIDHFKKYNDSCGHLGGDEALKRVAASLEQHCRRATDLAARYGGEEFVLLLRDTGEDAAAPFARAQLEAIRALRIPHPASNVADHVTLSMGVAATIPTDASSPADLLAAADRALYRAKEQGRNRVVLAGRAPLQRVG